MGKLYGNKCDNAGDGMKELKGKWRKRQKDVSHRVVRRRLKEQLRKEKEEKDV